MTNLDELRQLIRRASDAYYLGDTPIMSDHEFDQKVELLRELDPTCPLLHQVGFGARPTYGKKVKLPMAIQHSLEKIHTVEQVRTFWDGLPLREVSPKLDGMTAVLKYDSNGCLELACTRGDGEYGIDITSKMRYIKTDVSRGVPGACVRGELLIELLDFEALQIEYANPRNAVSGIINSKSFDGLEHVSFIMHGYDPNENWAAYMVPMVPLRYFVGSDNLLSMEILHDFYDIWKNLYPMDGLVLNGRIAFKFPTRVVEAEVAYVEWNQSPRGQLVPVVVFKDPIDLYGTKVQRASGFHAEFIRSTNIAPGVIVGVTKANEIIPYIVDVKHPLPNIEVTIPREWNGRSTYWDGLKLYVEQSMEDIQRQAVYNFMKSYFTVDGITDVDSVMRILNINTFYDLANMTPGMAELKLSAAHGWGGTKVQKYCPVFNWDRELDSRWFFASLGLRGVGYTHSEKLTKFVPLCNDPLPDYFLKQTFQILPVNVKDSLRRYWQIVMLAYVNFQTRLKYKQDAQRALTDWNIVLTGKFSVKKSVIEEALASAGIATSGSIDSKTKYLMQADPTSTSSKTQSAVARGILILGEDEAKVQFGVTW